MQGFEPRQHSLSHTHAYAHTKKREGANKNNVTQGTPTPALPASREGRPARRRPPALRILCGARTHTDAHPHARGESRVERASFVPSRDRAQGSRRPTQTATDNTDYKIPAMHPTATAFAPCGLREHRRRKQAFFSFFLAVVAVVRVKRRGERRPQGSNLSTRISARFSFPTAGGQVPPRPLQALPPCGSALSAGSRPNLHDLTYHVPDCSTEAVQVGEKAVAACLLQVRQEGARGSAQR